MSSTPQVGQPAPVFVLPDQDGTTINLVDYRDQWVVIYFYPKDDTPGCTVEACEFTSGLEGFEKLNATVFGVSADSPESHQQFIAKYDLKISLLSDLDTQMLQKYGVWGEREWQGKKYMGIARQTFIIDPKGKVAWHWPQVNAKGHAAEVQMKLLELAGKQ